MCVRVQNFQSNPHIQQDNNFWQKVFHCFMPDGSRSTKTKDDFTGTHIHDYEAGITPF